MRKRPAAGKLIVTRRAIVDIVRAAVQSSYGVTGFSDPSVGRRVLRWAGLDQPGIRLSTENGIALDLYVKVAFGIPVAEVARQVESAVRYALHTMVGVEVVSLRVHVDGLGYQPNAVQRAEAIEREIEIPIEAEEESRETPTEASGGNGTGVAAAGEKAAKVRGGRRRAAGGPVESPVPAPMARRRKPR